MEAATQARERQEESTGVFEQKCDEASATETIFHGTIENTPEKADEKHVKTVTTDADFFKTLFDRQEEAQKHLNELSAQLSQQNTTTRPHSKKCAAQKNRRKWLRHSRRVGLGRWAPKKNSLDRRSRDVWVAT